MSAFTERLRELDAGATKGKWRHDSRTGVDAVYVGDERNCLETGEAFIMSARGIWDGDKWIKGYNEADFALLATLRNALPAIIEALEAAENIFGMKSPHGHNNAHKALREKLAALDVFVKEE